MPNLEIIHADINPDLAAVDLERICYNAWRRSAWIRELAWENGVTADGITSTVFDENNTDHVARNKARITSVVPNSVSLLETMAGHSRPKGVIQIIPEYDFTDTTLQTVKPGIVCIQRLSVEQSAKRAGLAAALTATALSTLKSDISVSFYTAKSNRPMRGWGESCCFEVDDAEEYEQTFAVEEENGGYVEIKVPYLRYVHKSSLMLGQILTGRSQLLPTL